MSTVVNSSFFANKRILILGASGFIGGAVAEMLLHLSQENQWNEFQLVLAGRNVHRLQERFQNWSNVEIVKLDVLDAFPEMGRFDCILNAASGADPSSFSHVPVDVLKANVLGVDHVLQYAVSHGKCAVVQISSGEVYGYFENDHIVSENEQGLIPITDARSCYPMGKRAAETLCASYIAQYGIDVRIVRPSHVFGPGFTETDSRVSAQFFKSVLCGEMIRLQSTGKQKRTYIYISDCASAILTVMSSGKSGEAYNVTNTNNIISLADFASKISAYKDMKIAVGNSVETVSRLKKVACLNDDKLRSLGWEPVVSIDEGVRLTFKVLDSQIKDSEVVS